MNQDWVRTLFRSLLIVAILSISLCVEPRSASIAAPQAVLPSVLPNKPVANSWHVDGTVKDIVDT